MPAEAEASTRGHTRVPDSLTRAGAGAPPFRGASEAEGGGRRRSRRPDSALGAPATRSSRARRSCKRRKLARVSRTRARSPNSAARSTRIPHARLGSARLGAGPSPRRDLRAPGPELPALTKAARYPPRRQPQRLRALLLAATRSSPLPTLLARSPSPPSCALVPRGSRGATSTSCRGRACLPLPGTPPLKKAADCPEAAAQTAVLNL